jgi:pimeloyl-ACP methyl ester carboxylesterase
VVSYDRRERGDSGDTLPYDVSREVEDLAAVIAAAGGSAYAFGVSSGAMLVLEAAARGLPVRKVALVEPPYHIEGSRTPDPEPGRWRPSSPGSCWAERSAPARQGTCSGRAPPALIGAAGSRGGSPAATGTRPR